ncbi:MAG TPA: arginase family protein [Solirubrobacteraceae bacterium]
MAHSPVRTPCLIQVPFMSGDGAHPASAGPRRATESARELLGARGVAFESATVDVVAGDSAEAAWRVSDALASTVRNTTAAGQLPLVLAGSCDAALGVLAGFEHARCGVVWLDAHGDFNTPESSETGFLPGMALAAVVGHCHADRWAQIGDATPIAESDTLLLGVRELSPAAERRRLKASAIDAIAWRGGKAQRDPIAALDALAERVDAVYLHIDLDAFDPEVAPGIVDDPVPGGLSLRDGERVVRAVLERFRVPAATLATYVPARDPDGRTLDLELRLIELLAGV